jgi:hypothetical protein
MRPFAEAKFLPVAGRRSGISLPELMEGLHDFQKQMVDQSVDAGTIANWPFGFYRPNSSMKPEVLRPWAGDLLPLSDPHRDVNYPSLQGSDQSYALNMLGITQQMQGDLSLIGPLNLGRIPAGKSSAFRTAEATNTILGQSEARPERLIKRYYDGMMQLWTLMHRLNKYNMPEDKLIRIVGYLERGKDPYQTITAEDVKHDYDFGFEANALNSSRQAKFEGLQTMLGLVLNPLAIQMGILRPDGLFRMYRDLGDAVGQNAKQYLAEPDPEASLRRINAEEAASVIASGYEPQGIPMEGATAHLEKLFDFAKDDNFIGQLGPASMAAWKTWMQEVMGRAQQEQQQQAQMQAAAEAQAQQQPQGVPQGVPPDMSQPKLEGGELIDEGLATAGGGGAIGGPVG